MAIALDEIGTVDWRGLRKAAGLRVKDLAKRAGVRENYVADVERFRTTPTLTYVLGVAPLLRVSADELAEALGLEQSPTCPRCAQNPVENPSAGWCTPCALERVVEQYGAQSSALALARNREWALRLLRASRESACLRQDRKRLLARTRPKTRPRDGVDPLELADRALTLLHRAQRICAQVEGAPALLDEAAELVRQLAWGPD